MASGHVPFPAEYWDLLNLVERGEHFVDGIPSLRYIRYILAALGGPRRVFYFGDLDPQGLLIPQEASSRAHAAGLPAVELHLWSYRQLLTLGAGRGQPWEGEPPSSTLCDWIGDCAKPARLLFAAGQRLAQEYVGWEFFRGATGIVAPITAESSWRSTSP